ncbi:PilZ domain-containing protein [Desulfuromusa kysingii]|uniref:PilZ domain-containing protein n=1 Tax=Desulfuromusa kysingii TaxID=37625 RepID=A0A1H3ZEP1_9BACT|nr:PilZ domain-containing protein [Desulfuromusa kysingii]SEA21844.1 PilZ domain-containing protein [Desulfuromusa kysingii]
MLIMKCPKCSKYIKSALLAEIQTIVCEHCGAEVAVNNVLVSSNGFTFDRQDLLKRFFRYRKLLDEVIDENNSMAENGRSSAESKKSIKQFLTILQGMMTGARDNFRLQFSTPFRVEVCYGKNACSCNFYNLSMEGARVEVPGSNPLPKVREEIALEFSLPGDESVIFVTGQVCWTEKAKEAQHAKHNVGIKFYPLKSADRAVLWQYISTSASEELL